MDLGSEPSTACDHHQVILSLGNVRAGRMIANLPHAILQGREAEKVNDFSTVTARTAHIPEQDPDSFDFKAQLL